MGVPVCSTDEVEEWLPFAVAAEDAEAAQEAAHQKRAARRR